MAHDNDDAPRYALTVRLYRQKDGWLQPIDAPELAEAVAERIAKTRWETQYATEENGQLVVRKTYGVGERFWVSVGGEVLVAEIVTKQEYSLKSRKIV